MQARNEKKNNKKLLALLLLLTIIALILVSGTYARYTSTVSGVDSATVAKWSIEVNGTDITTAPADSISFNLFDTINDTDTADGTESTTGELDVTAGMIAPGVQGEFEIEVENLSDVTAQYTVSFESEGVNFPVGATVPIQYSADGTNWSAALTDITTPVVVNSGATSTSSTIYWRWPIGADAAADANDTLIGIAAAAGAATTADDTDDLKIQITTDITVTQVD